MPVEYKREIIADGIGLTVIKDNKFKTNSVVVRFLSKLTDETAAANSLIATLMVTANENYPTRTALATKLNSLYGTSLGSANSKQGDVQHVAVKADCIRDEYALDGEQITAEMTQILLDCIFKPVVENGGFEKKEFEIRKQELIDYIDSFINEKRGYAIKRAFEIVFRDEPFSINAYGSRNSAEKLEPVSLYEAYKNLLRTSRIEITVAGGGELEAAAEMMRKAFSSMERAYGGDVNFKSFSNVKPEVERFTEKMEVNQCKMVMAYKSDYDDIYVSKLMSALLGGTAFSKLFTNVREKLSLCYYCAARYVDGKGVLVIDSGVDKQNVELAEKAINEQLEDIAAGRFTDEELENTKLAICGDLRSSYDSVSEVMAWYFIQLTRGTVYTPEELIEIEKSITREQVIECAKSYKLDTVYLMESTNQEGDKQ